MNHRTPAEQFRAALAALSREQLEEAMHYLHARDPRAMDRALELVAAQHDHDDADLPWTSAAHAFIPCTTCTADACNACSRPAGDAVHRIAGDFGAEQVTEPGSKSPLSVDCPACGAPAGEWCTSAFGCTSRYNAAQDPS